MPDIRNAHDYQEYQAAVQAFWTREGLKHLGSRGSDSEPYFSWHPCECCGSLLGGNREC